MTASPSLPLSPHLQSTTLPRFATARKPDGGFLWLPVPLLLVAWLASQTKRLSALELRGLLACLEMAARRCQKDPDTPAHYGPDELAYLLKVRPTQARTVVTHLEATGFLTWTPQDLTITTAPQQLPWLDQEVYLARRTPLPAGLSRVPLPRRLGRWLAAQARPGLIGLTFGVSLRCLRSTQGACRVGGSVPLEALQRSFGLHERTARRHLRTLERLGWLTPVPTPAWHQQRYGRWYCPNLTWTPPPERPARPAPLLVRPRPSRQLPLPLPPAPTVATAAAPLVSVSPPPCAPEAALAPVAPPGSCPTPATPGPPPEAPVVLSTAPVLETPPAAPPDAAPYTALAPAALEALARDSLRAQGVLDAFLIAPVLQAEIARLQEGLVHPPASTPGDTTRSASASTKLSAPRCINVSAPLAITYENTTPYSSLTRKPLREKTQQWNLADQDTPGISHESPKTPQDTGSQAPTGPGVSADRAVDVPQETSPATPFAAPALLPPHPVDAAILPAEMLQPSAEVADAQTPAPSALSPAKLEALAYASLRQQDLAEDWLIAPVVQAEIDRLQADPACIIVVTPATDACKILTTDSSIKPAKATASVFSLVKDTGSHAPTEPDFSPGLSLDVPQETFPATTFAAPALLPARPVDTVPLSAATLQPSAEVFADIARFFQQSALATLPPPTDTLHAPALPPLAPDAALPPAAAAPPTVAWGAITPVHLQDLPSLLALHQLALAQGWLDRSEATRLALVTAAIHARRLGTNPAALFVSIVRQRRWSLCTADDEDRARHWLRQGQPSPPPPSAASWLLPAAPPPAQAATVPLDADAALARDLLQVLGVVGRQQDPWPLVAAPFAGDRARWDAALVALEHWQVLQAQANARHRAARAALAVEDEDDTDEDRDARDTEEA